MTEKPRESGKGSKHSPTLNTSPDAGRVKNIIDGVSFGELNESLIGKMPNRQKRILRAHGYIEERKSRIRDITHYVNPITGGQAIYLESIGGFISFGGSYIAENISAKINPDTGGKCEGFVVQKAEKYYLYQLTRNFTKNGETAELVVDDNTQGYDTPEEVLMQNDRAVIDRELVGKSLEEQKVILKILGFKPEQISSVEPLVHYKRRKPNLQFEYVLLDTAHGILLHFDGRFVCDDINVSTNGGGKVVDGIVVKRGDKYFFYVLGKEYLTTRKPQIRGNPNSPDGSFSSEFELDGFVNFYTKQGTDGGTKN